MPVQFPSRPSVPDPRDPDPVDDVPGATAPGAAHATAHLRGDAGNMSDPGVRLRLDAAGILPGGIPGSGAFRAANLAHTLSNASGAAALDLQVTHRLPGSGPVEDRGTVTAGVRAGAVARTETAGVDRLLGVMDQGAKVQKSAEKLYEDVRAIQTALAGSKDVARLKEIASAAGTRRLTPAEMLEANTLAGSIEAQLRNASVVLGQAAPVLDEIEGLVGGLGDGALSATASGAGGAFIEERLGFRTPSVRLGVIDLDVTRRVNHTLLPTAGVDLRLGPRLDPGKVTLGLNGGVALNLGGPGKGPEISGGQAGIGLTINF